MNCALMKQYIEFVADRLLTALQQPKVLTAASSMLQLCMFFISGLQCEQPFRFYGEHLIGRKDEFL